MRLYLDQMLRADLAERLRSDGHDVARAAETGQARDDDAAILARSSEDQRVLVTLDQHFGDWAVLPLTEHPGVLRLKTHPPTTENAARLLLPFLRKHRQAELRNRLVILSKGRIRWVKTTE